MRGILDQYPRVHGYSLGVGLGDRAHAYQQGVVTVDTEKVDCFGVIDGD